MKDLPLAIATTDTLVDLWALKATDGAGSSVKDKGKRKNDYKAEQRDSYKGKGKAIVGDSSKPKTGGCCIYDSPHRVCDFPRREQLNSLVTEEQQGPNSEGEEEQVRVNPLQVLVRVIQASTHVEGLIHVQIVVKGEDYYALVDSGASHNFMARWMAMALGL